MAESLKMQDETGICVCVPLVVVLIAANLSKSWRNFHFHAKRTVSVFLSSRKEKVIKQKKSFGFLPKRIVGSVLRRKLRSHWGARSHFHFLTLLLEFPLLKRNMATTVMSRGKLWSHWGARRRLGKKSLSLPNTFSLISTSKKKSGNNSGE